MDKQMKDAEIGDKVMYRSGGFGGGNKVVRKVLRLTPTRVVVGFNDGRETASFAKESGKMIGEAYINGRIISAEEEAAFQLEQHQEQCFRKAKNELRDVIVTQANMHLVLDFLAKLDAFDEEQAAKGE